jgi:hypothetical protein
MMSADDGVVPVWRVARILRLPSTQALWRMVHAGVLPVVWDKGTHAVPRASLAGYLEAALAAVELARADAEPLEDSPFAYCQAAAHVRRKIADGVLRPGERVVVAAVAAECGLGLNTVRKGLGVLVDSGELNHPHGSGWVVSTRAR